MPAAWSAATDTEPEDDDEDDEDDEEDWRAGGSITGADTAWVRFTAGDLGFGLGGMVLLEMLSTAPEQGFTFYEKRKKKSDLIHCFFQTEKLPKTADEKRNS